MDPYFRITDPNPPTKNIYEYGTLITKRTIISSTYLSYWEFGANVTLIDGEKKNRVSGLDGVWTAARRWAQSLGSQKVTI